MEIIRALGFVQLDTIRNVTRAHNHIIWSRNQNFREGKLWPLLTGRELFEHFTHDASLIPMEFYPMWQRQFQRMGDYVARNKWYQTSLGKSCIADIRLRIEAEGALSTHAFDTKIEGKREMWARPPHKKALDQMWYAGRLATCHREKFVKFYDLADRIFPQALRDTIHSDVHQINWLCGAAMDRLWLANPGEVQRFWDAVKRAEVLEWVQESDLVEIEVQAADRSWTPALALPDIQERLEITPAACTRLRILNPFDPAIRDRARLERLFGFEYRNEMFVPKVKRRWGYYVYPLLEKDRFVGRLELKADRNAGLIQVTGFWPEPGVKWNAPRHGRLDAELERFARFVGAGPPQWQVSRD